VGPPDTGRAQEDEALAGLHEPAGGQSLTLLLAEGGLGTESLVAL
jgi:hypothetical protein